MRKHLPAILAAVACLLGTLCLVQLAQLGRQLGVLESSLNNQTASIRNDVNEMSADLRNSLQAQAALLADSTWEYGAVDYDARTVELICTVSPKEYSAATTAAIVIGDTEYPMTLSAGAFKACASIPLFSETNVSKVLLRDADVTRTEVLGWYISPQYEYLLTVYAVLDGSATGTPRDGIYHYHRDGVMNINVDGTQQNNVAAITLVETMDGKVLGRTDIPLDNAAFFEGYQTEDGARPEQASATMAQAENGNAGGPFYYALKKDCEIPYGSTWVLYVELADSHGFIYRSVIDCQTISDSGEPTDDSAWFGMDAAIYDKDGNALYEPGEVRYR